LDTYLVKVMSRTIVALNWMCGSKPQMAAQAWALSGQVCFTKFYQIWRREKYFKPIFIGVTVYPGKRFLYRNMFGFFNKIHLDWFHPKISE